MKYILTILLSLLVAAMVFLCVISIIYTHKKQPIQPPSKKIIEAQYRLLNHKKVNIPDSVVLGFYMEDSTLIYAYYFDNAIDKLVPLGVYELKK